jgi:hypothetical protein
MCFNEMLILAIDGHCGMWRAALPVPRDGLDHRRDLGPQGKDPDGCPVRDSVSEAIDITDVAFG